jgi:hypothetical protein
VVAGVTNPELTLLPAFLQTFLPVRLAYYLRKGGASEDDYAKLETIAERICTQATALMWKNADGLPKDVVVDLLEALAIASSPPQNATPKLIEMAQYRKHQIEEWIKAIAE